MGKKKEYLEKIRIYEKGVKRLKELEKELNSLDTKKFRKYKRAIRKKLKSVSLIPEIEEDLRNLKLRIAGVDVDYKKAVVDKAQDKKLALLRREERDLKHGLQAIKKDLKVSNKESPIKKGEMKLAESTLLRNKITDLEKKLDEKEEEFKQESKNKLGFFRKRRLEKKIQNLKAEIEDSRLDLSKQLLKESSDSKGMIEKHKGEVKSKLKILVKEEKKKVKAPIKPLSIHAWTSNESKIKKEINVLPKLPKLPKLFPVGLKLPEFPVMPKKRSVKPLEIRHFEINEIPEFNKGIYHKELNGKRLKHLNLLKKKEKTRVFEIKEQKFPKKDIFIELQDFSAAEEELSAFKNQVIYLEREVKKSVSGRNSEKEQEENLLVNAQDIQEILSKINSSIFML